MKSDQSMLVTRLGLLLRPAVVGVSALLATQAASAMNVMSAAAVYSGTFGGEGKAASVSLPNGSFDPYVMDLEVKVVGGYFEVGRQPIENVWYINPQYNRLKLELDPIDSTVKGIKRNSWPYKKTGEGAWQYDNQNVIRQQAVLKVRTTTAEGAAPVDVSATTPEATRAGGLILDSVPGYRWQDRRGNFIDYEASGRAVSKGNRNDVRVWFEYADDSAELPVRIRDHFGRTFFRLSNTGVTDNKDFQVANPTVDRGVAYIGGLTAPSRVEDALGRGYDLTYVDAPIGYDVTYENGVETGRTIIKQKVLSKVIDPAGRTLTLSYGGTDRVSTATLPNGTKVTVTYAYDKLKKEFTLTRVAKDKNGVTVSNEFLVYDSEGQLVRRDLNGKSLASQRKLDTRTWERVDERGFKTQITRDEFDNVSRVQHPDGSARTLRYSAAHGGLLEVVDEEGSKSLFDYDTKGNLIRVTDGEGTPAEQVTEYTIDAFGQRLTATRKGKTLLDGSIAPDVTVRFKYDAAGNLIEFTDGEDKVTLFEHNRMGQVTKVTEPMSTVWRYEYDAKGQLKKIIDPLLHTTSFGYDGVGNLETITDAKGKSAGYTYNTQDQPLTRTSRTGHTTTTEYDGLQQVTRITDASGKGIGIEYDNFGRPKQATDAKGHVFKLGYAQDDGSDTGTSRASSVEYPAFKRQFKFDERSRLTMQTDVSGQEGLVTSWGYDKVGRQKSVTFADGKTRQVEYDALGRPNKLIDPSGESVTLQYDNRGNLVRMVDPRSNAMHFEYDKRGLMTKEIDALGKITQYIYDDNGRLEESQSANGTKVNYDYDDAGRVTVQKEYNAVNALVRTTTFTYDLNDNLETWSDGTYGGALAYDDEDRLTGETVSYGGAITLAHSYTYYPNGQVKTHTGPDGITITYSYDAAGQLERISIPNEGDVAVTDWDWVARKKVTLPGGTTQEFGYGGYLNMTRLQVKSPGQQTVFDLENKYGQLLEVSERKIDGDTTQYTYDDSARLETTTANAATVTYTLDAAGNRVGISTAPGAWTYDAANQLTQRGSGGAAVTYSYDDAGNLLQKVDAALVEPARTTTYAYDAFSRLTEVRDGAGSLVARYTYDPFDRRLVKEAGGNTTLFLHSDEGLAAEATAAGVVTATYAWHPEHDYGTYPLFARVPDTSGFRYVYFHNDQLGTPWRVTDKAGNLVWSANYDAFGKVALNTLPNPAVAITNNLRFAGQYFDAETGLHYNDRRYYDPDTGRYITRDPIGLAGGVNEYTYALANPVNFIDPTGEVVPLVVYLARNYAICMATCASLNAAISMATRNCVDFGLKDCAVGCLLSLLPVNPCGKFGKYMSMAAAAVGAASAFGGPSNSFTGDTLVHVRPINASAGDAKNAKAVLKPIRELKPGDEVLAFAEWKDKDSLSYEKVTDVFTSERQQKLVHLTLDNGETITATEGHPLKTTEGWRDAILVKKGGKLLLKGEGDSATVVEVKVETKAIPAFNLEVANAHTFYVGQEGALAHNARPNGGRGPKHGGTNHNNRIDAFVRRISRIPGVTNIRKNQCQVFYGTDRMAGRNRPDVQFDYKGKHYNREFDTNPRNSAAHGQTIQSNDPSSGYTGTLVGP